jgi:capsular exopolysaccharide synthesis family protein
MYSKYFGFNELPFRNDPDPRFFYMSTTHQRALLFLMSGIQEKKEILTVLGEPGTGKTALLYFFQTMQEGIDNNIKLVFITNPKVGLENLINQFHKQIITSKGASSAGGPEPSPGEVHQIISAIVVIDEAQDIEWPQWDQIQLSLSTKMDDQMFWQLVLIGRPEMQDKLDHLLGTQSSDTIPLNSYYMNALNESESYQYIEHRLKVAGKNWKDIFSFEVLFEVYRRSQGIPRYINDLCDKLLLIGFSRRQYFISQEMIHVLTPNSEPEETNYDGSLSDYSALKNIAEQEIAFRSPNKWKVLMGILNSLRCHRCGSLMRVNLEPLSHLPISVKDSTLSLTDGRQEAERTNHLLGMDRRYRITNSRQKVCSPSHGSMGSGRTRGRGAGRPKAARSSSFSHIERTRGQAGFPAEEDNAPSPHIRKDQVPKPEGSGEKKPNDSNISAAHGQGHPKPFMFHSPLHEQKGKEKRCLNFLRKFFTRRAYSFHAQSKERQAYVIKEYQKIKDNLFLANSSIDIQTVIFASSKRGEGTSTVATNFAVSLATTEAAEILLIDANLRAPRLHELFNLPKEKGLAEVLQEKIPWTDALHPCQIPNLSVITSGEKVINPFPLLESDIGEKIIQELREHFDYIILDSCAINSHPDTILLGSKVDGLVLVVQADKTRIESIQRARDILSESVCILGVVLNRRNYYIPQAIYRRL